MDKSLFRLSNHRCLGGWAFFPYCRLPCVDGQKYTFGECYQEGETMEEFIRLPSRYRYGEDNGGYPVPAGNLFTYCQISCANGTYTLRNLQDGHGVYLNNRVLRKGRDKKLEEGDKIQIIYLHFPTDEVNWWRRITSRLRKTFWRFEIFRCSGSKSIIFEFKENKVRKWKSCWPLCHPASKPTPIPCSPAVGEVLGNSLILSKIFEFLPGSSLESARLVSTLWERESFKLFKARTVSCFNISLENYNFIWLFGTSMMFFLYIQDMKKFGYHSNWRMTVSTKYRPGEVSYAKFWNDFDKFLSSPGLHVKRIHVHLLDCVQVKKFLVALLHSRLGETIEELSLHMHYHEGEPPGEDMSGLAIQELPSLKLFVIQLVVHRYDLHESHQERPANKFKRLIKRVLFPFCRNMHAISITSEQVELNYELFEEMEAVGNRGLPNLNEIKIKQIDEWGLARLQKLKDDRFRKIEINGFVDNFEMESLNMFLQKHKNVLEEVVLDIPLGCENYILPNLPFLKKDTIRFDARYRVYSCHRSIFL